MIDNVLLWGDGCKKAVELLGRKEIIKRAKIISLNLEKALSEFEKDETNKEELEKAFAKLDIYKDFICLGLDFSLYLGVGVQRDYATKELMDELARKLR